MARINDPEYAAGLRWVHDDADRGNPVSQFQYGEILIWAGDIEKTMGTGLDYLRRSSDNGYALAARELGLLYADAGTEWGNVFCPDESEAIKWFKRAAELGDVYATACMKLMEKGMSLEDAIFNINHFPGG